MKVTIPPRKIIATTAVDGGLFIPMSNGNGILHIDGYGCRGSVAINPKTITGALQRRERKPIYEGDTVTITF